MAEVLLQPTICLTGPALASATEQGVHAITFNRNDYEQVATIGNAEQSKVDDLTIAFGGVQKWLGPVRFDPNQSYYMVHERNGSTHQFRDDLPTFDPDEVPHTTIITCPIPKRWTSEEMAGALLRGLNTEPSTARVIIALNVGGAAIGGVAGPLLIAPEFQKYGMEMTTEQAVMLGAGFGLMLSGTATIFTGPFLMARRANRERRASTKKPFTVHYR